MHLHPAHYRFRHESLIGIMHAGSVVFFDTLRDLLTFRATTGNTAAIEHWRRTTATSIDGTEEFMFAQRVH